MAVLDLFSYRKRIADGETLDVFVYDELPDALRNQIIHIWGDAIGPYSTGFGPENNGAWHFIHDAIAREHGVLRLSSGPGGYVDCITYLHTAPVNKALDLIEASFLYIDATVRKLDHSRRYSKGIKVLPDDTSVRLKIE